MGAALNRIWWGGDPDLQNSITGLTLRDVYAVQRSWTIVYADPGKYGIQLFIRLFRLDPVTKTYFKMIRNMDEEQLSKSFQFKAHAINLMTSINTAVINLHQPEVVIALMNKLGESHSQRHVHEKHFNEVTEVLNDILQNDMKLSIDELNSWLKFIKFIYKHIFETLNDSNSNDMTNGIKATDE